MAMTDNDLDTLYKSNIGVSHQAALRAVWDSGFNYASSINSSQQGVDPSQTAVAATAITDQPTTTTDPSLNTP